MDDDSIDEEADEGDDLLQCPSCRRDVHEETQQCPHCGDWIEPVYAGETRKKRVWIAAAALLIVAWLLMVLLRLS